MRPNHPEEYIGVDVGTVRVGVARGSSAARLAEPLTTLPADTAIEKLKQIGDEHQAAGIVVGLPRGLDGGDSSQTRLVRDWAEQAKAAIGRPFYWQDEALTTVMGRQGDLKAGIDAAAAVVILQDFLDAPPDERVRC